MSLVDDLRAATSDEELDRREALGKITGGAFAVAGLGTAFTTLRFMRPNVLFEPPTRFRVGPPEDIAPGTLLVLPEQKLFVARNALGFFAMSATCTHLGCMTRFMGADGIFCPCHGSHFNLDGQVVGGPAPRPLPRYHLSFADGQLVVDTARQVDADFILRA
jgi:cytochrome b6-f complex iron-sulfur subunit